MRDAPGAWRFVWLFAARYAAPILTGDGCDEEELQAAEAWLDFPVPASLLRHMR